jgi:uncharacterized protein
LSFFQVLILLAAGFLGGAMNAMAGGASLVTFPALLSIGLPPIVANASNTVATSLFTFSAAVSEWKLLPSKDKYFWFALTVAILGGACGGMLLMSTPEKVFGWLVPLLIASGTALFAFSKRIQPLISSLLKSDDAQLLVLPALLFPITIYGGYFGAGLGVLVMASIMATSRLELRAANALKNLVGSVTNFAALPVFLWHGAIEWKPALLVLAGGLVGAQAGVALFRQLPTETLRRGIIAIGIVMSLLYAYRNWLS